MTFEIEDIKRLRIEPGDCLFVHVPATTTMEELQRLADVFSRHWPGVPTLIIPGEVELEVVSA